MKALNIEKASGGPSPASSPQPLMGSGAPGASPAARTLSWGAASMCARGSPDTASPGLHPWDTQGTAACDGSHAGRHRRLALSLGLTERSADMVLTLHLSGGSLPFCCPVRGCGGGETDRQTLDPLVLSHSFHPDPRANRASAFCPCGFVRFGRYVQKESLTEMSSGSPALWHRATSSLWPRVAAVRPVRSVVGAWGVSACGCSRATGNTACTGLLERWF